MNTREKCKKLYERFKKLKEETKLTANNMGPGGSYSRNIIDFEKVHERKKVVKEIIELNCDKLLIDAKNVIISELNDKCEIIKAELSGYREREIDYRDQLVDNRQQLAENRQQLVDSREREIEYKEREKAYKQEQKAKNNFILEITRKIEKYSRLLQENPNDMTIHNKIHKYRIKVMKMMGLTEEQMTEQMNELKL